jgi:hypothetical protein
MGAKNRTEQVVGSHAQKVLLSSQTEDDAYRLTTNAAVYMASCGFVDQANTLLSALWRQKRPHSQHVWLADRAMTVLWHHKDGPSPEAPFAIKAIETIELEHRAFMSGNRWSPDFLESNKAASPGQTSTKLLAKAMTEIHPAQGGAWPDAELQGIVDFESFRQSGFCHGFDAFSALTNLSELCAKHGRLADARRYILEWHAEYVRYPSNFIFECLAANRYASNLLLEGVLANACGLNQETCECYLQEWRKIVDRRFGGGPKLIYEGLDWPELLERINETALQETGLLDSSCDNQELRHDPASEDEIMAVEAKLGISLPTDYREFLRCSNGFEAIHAASARLVPVAELAWLRNAYSGLLEVWNTSDLQDTYEGLERSLLIGDLDGEQLLLLIRQREKSDVGEQPWECWFFASWVPGEVRYWSFRGYMEHVLLQLESGDFSTHLDDA